MALCLAALALVVGCGESEPELVGAAQLQLPEDEMEAEIGMRVRVLGMHLLIDGEDRGEYRGPLTLTLRPDERLAQRTLALRVATLCGDEDVPLEILGGVDGEVRQRSAPHTSQAFLTARPTGPLPRRVPIYVHGEGTGTLSVGEREVEHGDEGFIGTCPLVVRDGDAVIGTVAEIPEDHALLVDRTGEACFESSLVVYSEGGWAPPTDAHRARLAAGRVHVVPRAAFALAEPSATVRVNADVGVERLRHLRVVPCEP